MSVDWIALAIAVVTAFGAAATYAYQRRVDRETTLIEKRREVFATYVLAVQRNLMGHKDDIEYQTAFANIFIYGKDDVVRAVNEFHAEVADRAGHINGERAAEAYAKMLAAMRADCFASTSLDLSEMKKTLPFRY